MINSLFNTAVLDNIIIFIYVNIVVSQIIIKVSVKKVTRLNFYQIQAHFKLSV